MIKLEPHYFPLTAIDRTIYAQGGFPVCCAPPTVAADIVARLNEHEEVRRACRK